MTPQRRQGLPPLELGLFAHVAEERSERPLYDEILALFEHAEALGLATGWVRQFHFHAVETGRSGGLPSPFVFHAALAARTTRLHVGTAAITLPLENLVRVAEDASVLDVLSHGRLELGVAKGYGPPGVLTAFERDIPSDSDGQRAQHAERLARLVALLDQAEIPGTSERVYPPAPGLTTRIWEAALTDRTGADAARRGNGVQIGTTQTVPAEITAAAYHDNLPDGVVPRVGVSTLFLPAGSREEALRIAEDGILRKWEWGKDFLPPATTLAEKAASIGLHYGTADDIAESIARHPAFPSATQLLLQTELVYDGFAQREDALSLFVEEIAPSLGAITARETAAA